MKTNLKIAAAGVFLLLVACGKEGGEPIVDPTLTILPATEELSFGAAAKEEYTFEVITNQPEWEARSDRDWCKIIMDTEANTFAVKALENEAATAPDPATLTLSAGEAVSLTLAATQAAAGYDLFLAGQYRKEGTREIICFWKNGEREDLTDGMENSDCSSMTAVEGSVYITGRYGTTPIYWKDGERHDLINKYYATFSVAVDDGSVYVLGYDFYWKDDVPVELESPDFRGSAIVVSDGTVYVAGTVSGEKTLAACWSDGRTDPLAVPEGSTRSEAVCAAASEGSVYIGGSDSDEEALARPCYWKGNSLTTFELPRGASYGWIDAICVKNGTVYAGGIFGGEINGGCYWSDGMTTLLEVTDDTREVVIAGIAVADGKVYVGGCCRTKDWVYHPCYWVDGKRIDLDLEAGITDAKVRGFALVKK